MESKDNPRYIDMKILIKNANVVMKNEIINSDILIDGDKISKILPNLNDKADKTIDANGKYVLSAFIDMHCHLREPGLEHKEDMKSGLSAAVAGGFASVCCMPNTKPCIDNKVVVKYIVDRAKEIGLAKVYPIGAISKGQEGKELSEIATMREYGIIAVSDDGVPVVSSNLMRLCLEYIKPFNILAISHCEDKDLVDGGVVNEGSNATLAGLKGSHRAAEEIMIARDIILAEALGTRVHIAHVSSRGSVILIREAKARGVDVTCETCPHYVVGDDSMILSYDTNTKVNPPLREKEDVQAIIKGLKDGTIDCIATDHAPHHENEKNVEYNFAPFGISGFETAFSLCYTHLVKTGILSLSKLSELMTVAPARILGLENRELAIGGAADLVIAELGTEYKIDKNKFKSKGKNTPFDKMPVFGRIEMTIVDGDIKYIQD